MSNTEANKITSLDVHPPIQGIQVPAAAFATFTPGGAEIMRIDKDGMVYMGKRIDDAGEAHRAFIDAMGRLGARGRG
jgi:hypothetical protein